MYEISYNSFIKFNKHLDIPFSDIDVTWLKRYEAWSKEHNLSVSTISTRLRHLRAVFNLALLEQAIKSDCYPVQAYKVSKLSKETAKRALTKDDVRRIMESMRGNLQWNVLQSTYSHSPIYAQESIL